MYIQVFSLSLHHVVHLFTIRLTTYLYRWHLRLRGRWTRISCTSHMSLVFWRIQRSSLRRASIRWLSNLRKPPTLKTLSLSRLKEVSLIVMDHMGIVLFMGGCMNVYGASLNSTFYPGIIYLCICANPIKCSTKFCEHQKLNCNESRINFSQFPSQCHLSFCVCIWCHIIFCSLLKSFRYSNKGDKREH